MSRERRRIVASASRVGGIGGPGDVVTSRDLAAPKEGHMAERTNGICNRQVGLCDAPDCGYCNHIRDIVAAAPPLTDEQRHTLRSLLIRPAAPSTQA